MDALPDLASGDGKVTITAHIRNASSNPWAGRIFFRVVDDATGLEVLASPDVGSLSIQSDTTRSQTFQTTLPKAKLCQTTVARRPYRTDIEKLRFDEQQTAVCKRHAAVTGVTRDWGTELITMFKSYRSRRRQERSGQRKTPPANMRAGRRSSVGHGAQKRQNS